MALRIYDTRAAKKVPFEPLNPGKVGLYSCGITVYDLQDAFAALRHPSIEVIQLSVISDNQPARRLYGSLGFVEYGLERDSLKQNGRYYDEVLMALDLRLDLDQYALPSAHTGAALREELTSSSAE